MPLLEITGRKISELVFFSDASGKQLISLKCSSASLKDVESVLLSLQKQIHGVISMYTFRH